MVNLKRTKWIFWSWKYNWNENLLHELNGRCEIAGVRIGGPKYRTLEIIQNQKGKKWKKLNRESETVKHLYTYQHTGVMGVLERKEQEKRAGKCIHRINAHNFQN